MKTALSILSENQIQDFMTSRNITQEEALRRLGNISLKPIAETQILKTKEFLKEIGKL